MENNGNRDNIVWIKSNDGHNLVKLTYQMMTNILISANKVYGEMNRNGKVFKE